MKSNIDLGLLIASALIFAGCNQGPSKPPLAPEVGQLGNITLGVPLSPQPGAKPDRVANGVPALVLDVVATDGGQRWYRILAADGSAGWTSDAPTNLLLVGVTTSGAVLDRSPDEDGEGKAVTLETPATIVGAARRTTADESPWLKLESKGKTGWARANSVQFTLTGAASVQGLVRPPFPMITPDPGSRCVRVDIDGKVQKESAIGSDSWSPVSAAVFAGPRAVYSFPGKAAGTASLMLLVENQSEQRCAVIDAYSGSLRSAALADVDGDEQPEWLVETAVPGEKGSVSTLWVLAKQAQPIALGDSATSAWWFDAAYKQVWVVRTSGIQRVSMVKGKLESKTGGTAVVISEPKETEAQATAAMLEFNARMPVFPVTDGAGKLQWASGRLFPTEKDAADWQKSSPQSRLMRFGAKP